MTSIRDNLLITAGSRAAYMDAFHVIDLPYGVDGEDEVADFVTKLVDEYITNNIDEPFDVFIEKALMKRYNNENNRW